MPELPPHYIELVQDAVLKIYHFKDTFRSFLVRSGVPQGLISTFTAEETKRTYLSRLFPTLEESDGGAAIINRMADDIMTRQSFPDLLKVEDSRARIAEAKAAQSALGQYRREQQDRAVDERDRVKSRAAAKAVQDAARKRVHTLDVLQDRLTQLLPKLGTQAGGYAFETWFYDLVDFYEVPSHRPYRAPDGRQIDGSVTPDGTTYLVELKFEAKPADIHMVDSFRAKLLGKADNTMAIAVAMSGFTESCKQSASGDRTPFLLFDSQHIYMLLTGVGDLKFLIERTRRHSSRTGLSYLAPADFGK